MTKKASNGLLLGAMHFQIRSTDSLSAKMCHSHPFTLIAYQVDEIDFGDIWLRRSNRVFLSKRFSNRNFKENHNETFVTIFMILFAGKPLMPIFASFQTVSVNFTSFLYSGTDIQSLWSSSPWQPRDSSRFVSRIKPGSIWKRKISFEFSWHWYYFVHAWTVIFGGLYTEEIRNYKNPIALIQISTVSFGVLFNSSNFGLDNENVDKVFVDFYTKCSYEDSDFKKRVYGNRQWINLLFYALIPFVSITTMNLILLARLLYSVHQRKKNLEQNVNSFSIGGSSLLLISAGLLYVVCTGPIGIYHIYMHIWTVNRTFSDNPEKVAFTSFWRSILENMSYLTNALSFVVYCISGSRFREEFISMVRCNSTAAEQQTISSTKSMSSLNTTTV